METELIENKLLIANRKPPGDRWQLADEPSGNLDSESAKNLHELFFKLRDKFGQTFILVTHNEELAEMTDRKLTMIDGKIV